MPFDWFREFLGSKRLHESMIFDCGLTSALLIDLHLIRLKWIGLHTATTIAWLVAVQSRFKGQLRYDWLVKDPKSKRKMILYLPRAFCQRC